MLQELLQRLLGGAAPMNRLASVGMSPRAESAGYSYGPGGQYTGGAPIAAPSAAPAPMPAPTGAPMPQTAPQARSGGLGGIVSGILGGNRAGKQEVVDWLTQQGMDPGTASVMAGNKGVLQRYILERAQGPEPVNPKDALELEKLRLEIEDKRNPKPATTDDIREYQLAKSEGFKGSFADWRKEGASQPSAIAEYEYAKSQGFPGTLQDWEASKKGGMSLQVDPETGAISFQQGSNIKPMTEAQSKDTVFATKAEGALPLIDKYGDALTSPLETAAGSVPMVGNYMKSEEYQQAEQAGGEFLAAILRKESGAAITVEERAEYGRVYLPQPGDSTGVLAQKKASRQRALDAIKAGMTPQAILAQERALQRGAQPSADRFGNDPDTSKGDRLGKPRLRYNPQTGELE